MQTKIITLTAGSITNSYFGTLAIADLVPADTVGGSSKAQCAPMTISVDYGGGLVRLTDVDGTKHILRDRKTFRAFIRRHHLHEGDRISVTRTGPHSLKIDPI